MNPTTEDRNLLFGILAVQAGFVRSNRLVDAMNAWTLAKHRPLGDILKERGDLSAPDFDLIAALVERQLAKHDGDAAASLAALDSATPVRSALAAVPDPDVQASLRATVDVHHSPRLAGGLSSSSPRFRIIKAHAKGGLGEVFLAADGEINRQVALKEIRSDRAADEASVGRFVKEAEITGQFEHPGVVPIYGAGTYADGRPFYAMRFIHGLELKQVIAEFHSMPEALAKGPPQSPSQARPQSPSLARQAKFATKEFRDLLGRFIDVCQAVAYAHSRGVLHRDLKPGNVMLGKYGETLVVDWGLAKVVGRDDPTTGEQTVQPSSVDSGETLPGNILGTPQYMSPEQAAGRIDELGPATDIYALGAILQCLLTGAPPIEPGSIQDVLRRVKESRLLPTGEAPLALAAVARKAMRPDPDQRYRSALDLAAEVEHWLADEPVSAFRDPPLAKAARWTRKHPATTAGTAAAALMLLIGLGVGLSVMGGYNQQLAKANDATEAKNRELDASNDRLKTSNADLVASRREVRAALDAATDEAIEDLLAGKEALTDKERRYLENAAKRYEAFAKKRGDTDEAVAFEAAGLFRVGSIRRRLSLLAEGEAAWVKAMALREKLAAANPTVAEYVYDLAHSQNDLGNLYRDTGRTLEAEAAHGKALALREKLSTANPTVADYQNAVASSNNNLGLLYRATGRTKEAEAALGKALALKERLAAANPTVAIYQHDLATSLNNQGLRHLDIGRMKEAETAYDKAMVIQKKLAAANPTVVQYQIDLAQSHDNLALLHRVTGRTKEAEAALGKALALLEKLAMDNPSVADYQNALAGSHNSLGNLYRETGRTKEAEAALGEALALREKLAAANPTVADYQGGLSSSHNTLGDLYRETGRMKEAEVALSKALALRAKLAAANPTMALYQNALAGSHNSLGRLYGETGRTKEAEAALGKALALKERLAADNPADVVYQLARAYSLNNLGNLYGDTGRTKEAEEAYRRALAVLSKLAADNPSVDRYQIDLASYHVNLGHLCRDTKRPIDAMNYHRRAIELLQPVLAGEARDATARQCLRNAHVGDANALDDLGRHAEAAASWRYAVELSPPADRLHFLNNLAFSLARAGMALEAVKAVEAFGKEPEDDWNAASVLSLASVANDVPAADKEKWQAEAVVRLGRAKQAAKRQTARRMAEDKDLDPLRGRTDFKALITAKGN